MRADSGILAASSECSSELGVDADCLDTKDGAEVMDDRLVAEAVLAPDGGGLYAIVEAMVTQ